MNRILKSLIVCFLASFVIFIAGYSSYKSSLDKIVKDKYHLSQPSSISNYYAINEKNAIKQSVASSVHVVSSTPDGTMISLSSGTYLKFQNTFYVLTTSHGLIGECSGIAIIYFEEYVGCNKILVNNTSMDYALIEVDEIQSRKAVKFPAGFSKNYKSNNLMDKVYYTGYPNSGGPLTFGGTISGFDEYGFIYMHSYAWSGSSGAGVFDSKGKLTGMIMAIDVGTSEYGVDVLEDIVVVVPAEMIDWAPVFHK